MGIIGLSLCIACGQYDCLEGASLILCIVNTWNFDRHSESGQALQSNQEIPMN